MLNVSVPESDAALKHQLCRVMQPWLDILSSMGSSGVDFHQGRKKNELLVPPRLSHPLSHRQRLGGKEGAWKWWEAKRFGSAELESRSPWVPVGHAAVPRLLSRHWECPWIQPHSNGEGIPPSQHRGGAQVWISRGSGEGEAVPGSLLTSARGQPSARACAGSWEPSGAQKSIFKEKS